MRSNRPLEASEIKHDRYCEWIAANPEAFWVKFFPEDKQSLNSIFYLRVEREKPVGKGFADLVITYADPNSPKTDRSIILVEVKSDSEKDIGSGQLLRQVKTYRACLRKEIHFIDPRTFPSAPRGWKCDHAFVTVVVTTFKPPPEWISGCLREGIMVVWSAEL